METDTQLDYIRKYVHNRRERQQIVKLSNTSLPEGSCIGAGEMNNLLYQLVYTREPYGDWNVVLNQPDITLLLFNHVLALTQK